VWSTFAIEVWVVSVGEKKKVRGKFWSNRALTSGELLAYQFWKPQCQAWTCAADPEQFSSIVFNSDNCISFTAQFTRRHHEEEAQISLAQEAGMW
jgi:hypothetical protein